MVSESTSKKIAILTGAGASVKMGIPVMNEMVQKYLASEKPSENIREALDLLQQIGVAKDLEDMLLAIREIIGFDETSTHAALLAASRKRGYANLKIPTSRLTEIQEKQIALESDIERWIAKICFKFDRDVAEEIWGDLSRILEKNNVLVFTTNYDFALEDTAAENGVAIIDNFITKSLDRMYWDASLQGFEAKGLKVVKLHGSVNWYITPDETEVEKINNQATENRDGVPVNRVAIFPTRFKDIYASHFFSLYRMFLKTLDEAEVLIIIGHSLRDEYLSAAIRESFRRPDFKVVYVGPTIPEYGGLKEELEKANPRVAHLPFNFEDSYRLVEHLVNADTSDNVIRDANKMVKLFDQQGELSLLPVPTWKVEAGKALDFKLGAKLLAVPSTRIQAKLEKDEERNLSGGEISFVSKDSDAPLVLRGVIDDEFDVTIEFAEAEILDNRELILSAVSENHRVLATKKYKIRPERTKSDAPGNEPPDDSSQQQASPKPPANGQ